ncbi:MAG: ankyrin repeat domain-containing protein [Alphaproteobacteria bacterium]|nr:MAG: ankyrin repeat domain-containing protein [Alphaproteobacteria bacterium]
MADEEFTEEQAKVVDKMLFEAVEEYNAGRIRLLIQKGADINARNDQGRTPLMAAVWKDSVEMVRLLLEFRPKLFVKDNSGKNAFDLIASVRDANAKAAITGLLLGALPDHVRNKAVGPAEAAALAQASSADDPPNVTTGADITVSKPIAFPPRNNPKGFSL